jgi:macrolide-specific efflux system membrane fusion protein
MFIKWWTENLSNNKPNVYRRLGIICLCFVLVMVAGCGLLPKEDEEEEMPVIKAPTISKRPEYTVTKETLKKTVTAVGKLMSQREEPLYFTNGDLHIKAIHVKAGDKVKQGAALIELDTEALQKDLRKLELEFKQQELDMKQKLRQKEEMDELEFEKATIVFEEQRQGLVDARKKISDGVLRAPFAGTIVSLNAEKGATIKAYDSLGIISDTSSLVVAASFSKDDLPKLSVGMDAEVDINAAGTFKGKVKVMPSPTATSNNNNQNQNGGNTAPQKDSIDQYLIVALDKMPKDMERGRQLGVTIVTEVKQDATVIPIAALRSIGSRNYVQVIEDDGSKREVDVEVGMQTSTSIEIKKGLTPGQKVVGR